MLIDKYLSYQAGLNTKEVYVPNTDTKDQLSCDSCKSDIHRFEYDLSVPCSQCFN